MVAYYELPYRGHGWPPPRFQPSQVYIDSLGFVGNPRNDQIVSRYQSPVGTVDPLRPYKDFFRRLGKGFVNSRYTPGRPVLAQASQDTFAGLGRILAEKYFAWKRGSPAEMAFYRRLRRRRIVKKKRYGRVRSTRRRFKGRRYRRRRYQTVTVIRLITASGMGPGGLSVTCSASHTQPSGSVRDYTRDISRTIT